MDGGPDDPPVHGTIQYDITGRGFIYTKNSEVTKGGWVEFFEDKESTYGWGLFDNVSSPWDRSWMNADLVYANGGKYRKLGEAYNRANYVENDRNTYLATANSGYNRSLVGKHSIHRSFHFSLGVF